MKISDIAKLAGVSSATVSRVINNSGYVSTQNRARVEEVIATTGYRINQQAKALRVKESKMIACIVPALDSTLMMDITHHLIKFLEKQEYNLIVSTYSHHTIKNGLMAKVKDLSSRGVDGFIIMNFDWSPKMCKNLDTINLPTVFLSSPVDDYYTVTSDFHSSGYLLCKHAIENGFRNIAIIKPTNNDFLTAAVNQGIMACIDETGYSMFELVEIEASTGMNHHQLGIEVAQKLLSLENKPDVVLSPFDRIAIIAQKICHENGQMIHFGGVGNIEMSSYSTPSLTTVDQNNRKMAEETVAMLIKLIRGEPKIVKKIVIEGRLIVRSSI